MPKRVTLPKTDTLPKDTLPKRVILPKKDTLPKKIPCLKKIPRLKKLPCLGSVAVTECGLPLKTLMNLQPSLRRSAHRNKGEVSPGGGAGGAEGDARQRFQSASALRPQNPTFDAERLRASRSDGAVEPEAPTVKQEIAWTLAADLRYNRGKILDRRSVVIWGVPVTAAVQVLYGLCLPLGLKTKDVVLA